MTEWTAFQDAIPTERRHLLLGSPGLVTTVAIPMPGTDLWHCSHDGDTLSRVDWRRLGECGERAWASHWAYVDPPGDIQPGQGPEAENQ